MAGNDNVEEQSVNNHAPLYNVYLIVLSIKLYEINVLHFKTQTRRLNMQQVENDCLLNSRNSLRCRHLGFVKKIFAS
jgi:hypothetical protein